MAYTPIYTRKNFVNNSAPAINATNLNDIEDALVSLENGLQTAAADTDTNTAAITTINGEISDLNNLIDEILPDDSESGNPAVITDAFTGECKSLVLTLEPIQSGSGTPSPQNVRAIMGRTQSTATRTGKNLVFKTISECNINASGVLESNNSYAIQVAYLKGGVTYTLTSDENRFVGGYFSSDPSIGSSTIDNTRIISNDTTITPAVDCWVAFRTYNNYATPQLEVGSTATAYEPYNGETKTISLGQTVYGGVLDVTSGELTDEYVLITLNNVQSADLLYADLGTYARVEYMPMRTLSHPLSDFYSDKFATVSGRPTGEYQIARDTADDDVRCWFTFPKSVVSSLSDAVSVINTLTPQLAYKKATPTTVQLTAEEVTLLKGDNVITTDADNVDVEYKADIALYIAKQLSGNLGNRGAKSAPAEEPADDTKEEEKTDEKIIEPVTKEAKK